MSMNGIRFSLGSAMAIVVFAVAFLVSATPTHAQFFNTTDVSSLHGSSTTTSSVATYNDPLLQQQIAYFLALLAGTQQAYGAYTYQQPYQYPYQQTHQTSTPYYPTYQYQSAGSEVDVETRSATNIEGEEAELRGTIDFNGSDEATVWFQYGLSSTSLTETTSSWSLDEDDDDEDFERTLRNLRERTRYYYRAAAADEYDRVTYGDIRTFVTDDDSSSDDEPDVDTDDADDIDNDSAELNGDVDMNDFRNGLVFFVYGEHEDDIEDVEDEDEYDDIDEDGDDIQKVRVDSDLDDDDSYSEGVRNLESNTRHYFRICVEYEDEDDDETLECGNVEEFRTD
jgi:hypothetical protein